MTLDSRPSRTLVPLALIAILAAAGARPVPVRDAGAAGATAADLSVSLSDEVFGLSGAMRTVTVRAGERLALPTVWAGERPDRIEYRWRPVLGTPGDGGRGVVTGRDAVRAPEEPGVYELELGAEPGTRRFGEALRLVVTVPFERKRNGYIDRYFMGSWPTEGSGRTDRYAPPAGFIKVTRANQHLRLSEHFSLREFLTHDQGSVWPKYVVVDPRLLDKLELVMTELGRSGVAADRMIVMSGFRTPQYNRKGLDKGRANLSRHQYGDAADVWIDNDRDWYMDDLNGDGRRDTRDARVMLGAVERVERRYPELLGGAGIYPDNGAHGPFIHIDVRGKRARW